MYIFSHEKDDSLNHTLNRKYSWRNLSILDSKINNQNWHINLLKINKFLKKTQIYIVYKPQKLV